jgi:internalin A
VTAKGDYVFEEEPEGRSLVITGPWSDAAAQVLAHGEADGLVLNYARGFEGLAIDFLDEGLRVRRLDLLDRGIRDLGPIERLADSLEELSVQAAEHAELDLAALPHLRSVAGEWGLIGPTLGSVDELRSVITWRFAEVDLHAFRGHLDLERLTIKEAPYLESLSGIGELPDLAVLEIVLARKLVDISDVVGLAESLHEFKLEDCRAIDAIDEVASLVNLRFLEVGDCGGVESLRPMATLEQLEELYAWGSTKILDNDLSPLARLPRLREIRMQDRRSYKPRVAELVAARTA